MCILSSPNFFFNNWRLCEWMPSPMYKLFSPQFFKKSSLSLSLAFVPQWRPKFWNQQCFFFCLFLFLLFLRYLLHFFFFSTSKKRSELQRFSMIFHNIKRKERFSSSSHFLVIQFLRFSIYKNPFKHYFPTLFPIIVQCICIAHFQCFLSSINILHTHTHIFMWRDIVPVCLYYNTHAHIRVYQPKISLPTLLIAALLMMWKQIRCCN